MKTLTINNTTDPEVFAVLDAYLSEVNGIFKQMEEEMFEAKMEALRALENIASVGAADAYDHLADISACAALADPSDPVGAVLEAARLSLEDDTVVVCD
jgi:hypothetical protein